MEVVQAACGHRDQKESTEGCHNSEDPEHRSSFCAGGSINSPLVGTGEDVPSGRPEASKSIFVAPGRSRAL
jgi:hypothetical protein